MFWPLQLEHNCLSHYTLTTLEPRTIVREPRCRPYNITHLQIGSLYRPISSILENRYILFSNGFRSDISRFGYESTEQFLSNVSTLISGMTAQSGSIPILIHLSDSHESKRPHLPDRLRLILWVLNPAHFPRDKKVEIHSQLKIFLPMIRLRCFCILNPSFPQTNNKQSY